MRRKDQKNGRTQNSLNTQRKVFSAIPACSAWIVLVAGLGFSPAVTAQSRTRTHVETLASPRLEGRLAGSNGEKLASDYIVAELQKIGAKPLPGKGDYRLPFDFTAGTRDGGSRISIGAKSFDTQADVRALSFSDNAEVSGDVVFAGYGIVVPDARI